MDKKWVREQLVFLALELEDCGDRDEARPIVTEYAEAIAAQHEAEVAHLKARQLCGHPVACVKSSDEGTNYCEMCVMEGSIERLQAREALMAEALETAGNALCCPEQYDLDSVYKQAQEALSAAPKVRNV